MAGLIGTGSSGTIGKVGIPKLPTVPGVQGQPKLAGVSAPKTVSGGFKLAGAPAPKLPSSSLSGSYKPPPAPTAGASTSSSAGGGGSASTPAPLDATALSNIAAYINKTNGTLASYGTVNTNPSGTYTGVGGTAGADQAAYNQSMLQLQQQEPLAALKLMSADNAKGGFYSSAYAGQQANNTQNYANKESVLTGNLNSKLGALATKIAELQSSIGPYEQQQGAASAARLTKTAAATPAPAPAPATASPAPGAVGSLVKPAPKGKTPAKNAPIVGRVGSTSRYAATRG